MRVRISYAIEVDEEAWAKEYGLDVEDVREDIKSMADQIWYQEHLADMVEVYW